MVVSEESSANGRAVESRAMDAALAAVCGAVAGSLATFGAALATGWSQREGAKIAARANHRRDQREPRHNVDREFISSAVSLREQVGDLIGFDFPPPIEHFTSAYAQRAFELSDQIKEKWLEVALTGPKSIINSASSIQRGSHHLASLLTDLSSSSAQYDATQIPDFTARRTAAAKTIAEALSRKIDEFVVLAQTALDDDGTV